MPILVLHKTITQKTKHFEIILMIYTDKVAAFDFPKTLISIVIKSGESRASGSRENAETKPKVKP